MIFVADGGMKRKFPLLEAGKVRVVDVLTAFDAFFVEVGYEDGVLSVLTVALGSSAFRALTLSRMVQPSTSKPNLDMQLLVLLVKSHHLVLTFNSDW